MTLFRLILIRINKYFISAVIFIGVFFAFNTATVANTKNNYQGNTYDKYDNNHKKDDDKHTPLKIVATKLECAKESYLPNWGVASGHTIDSTTAINYVNSMNSLHGENSCWFVQGWKFQWGYESVSNPGDTFLGEAPYSQGWFNMPETDSNGVTSTLIYDIKDSKKLWVREVLPLSNDYLTFTYGPEGQQNTNDHTAEIYCHIDAVNYDNFDEINDLSYGKTYYCVGFNVKKDADTPVTPLISIEKFNDAQTPSLRNILPGGSVNYTLKLKVTENGLDNLRVKDLLPQGFKYRSGSWSAKVNGNPISISEPQYHSPGVWNIGSVSKDDVIELSYTADVQSDVESGLYKDLAWAVGQSAGNSVIATASSTGKVNETFVGTEVNVVHNISSPEAKVKVKTKTEEKQGEVLSSSISKLPATGASTILVVFMALIFIGGLFMMLKSKKILGLVIFAMLFGSFNKTYAATSDVVVRLEDPKSPVSQNFNITFVALDQQDRSPLTAQCYVKKPGDLSFTAFGNTITLSPQGGDTSKCVVDNNVLDDDGTYEFYVKASVAGDTGTSNTTSVSYDSHTPGKPKSLEKDKIDSCTYKITLKTASDGGDTTRVELYRSDEKEFTVSDSNKIKDLSVGSDTKIDFETTRPTCDKTYYYAIRAFDVSGNASDVKVEEITRTVTTSSTQSSTDVESTALTSSNLLTEVGESTNDSNVVLSGSTNPGSVLGEKFSGKDVVSQSSSSNRTPKSVNVVIGIVLFSLGTVIFNAIRKNKK